MFRKLPKGLKIALGISFFIFLGMTGLCFGLLSFLRSPAGIQYLTNKGRTFLEQKSQLKIELKKITIESWSKIHLEGLHLTPLSPLSNPQSMDIEVESIEIGYHFFSLLSLSLGAEVIIHDLNLVLSLKSPEPQSRQNSKKYPNQHETTKINLGHLTTQVDFEWIPGHLKFKEIHLNAKTLELTHSSQKQLAKKELKTLKASDFELKATAELPTDFTQIKSHINSKGTASLNSIPFCTFDLQSQLGTEVLLSSKLNLTLDPRLTPTLSQFIPPLTLLKDQGLLHEAWNLILDSKIRWMPKQEEMDLNASLRVENKWGKWMAKTQFNSKIHSESQASKSQIQAQGSVSLHQEGDSTLKKLSYFLPLSSNFNFSLNGDHRFTLKDLTADFNQTFVKLVAEATGDMEAQTFQTKGSLHLNISKSTPLLASQGIESHSLEGEVEFPWSFAMYRGRDIHLDGIVNILNLNWIKSPTKASPFSAKLMGISGKAPISEQLLWTGKELRYRELISQNPFERVDFDRLQPMIYDSDHIFIREIGFEEKVYGPLQGFFSMRQNRVLAHRFDLQLGSGRVSGEMNLDTYPPNRQFGILARLTQLSLNELLPKRYLKNAQISPKIKPETHDRISGRSGLVMGLNSGSINGRVDITEIGKNQLLTLINLMDPHYEDQQMNRARFALGIAYPSLIQMSFQQGYMDMGFHLKGAINQEFTLRGIPISSWISRAKAEYNRKPQGGTSP